MKIQFSADLDYQAEATASIVDVFKGQETCRTNFTVAALGDDPQMSLALEGESSDLGIGNRLRLLEEDILENVRAVQLRNGLAQSAGLDGRNFTVEMETGTGKTYVYLRTIFELNREYGFTKFIIVVPSVAIKEGVYKSLQITEEHFRGLYDNVRCDYFVYDSQKLGQVRNFATSDCIQIMVINIDAFRKSFTDPSKEDKANIIHRPHDRMTGNRPDRVHPGDQPDRDHRRAAERRYHGQEPRSDRIAEPAVHPPLLGDPCRQVQHAVPPGFGGRLRAQAGEADRGLGHRGGGRLQPRLREAAGGGQPPRRCAARIELDVAQEPAVRSTARQKWVRSGDDLLDLSGGRSVYDGYIIEEIYCGEGSEYISFTSKPDIVRLHESIGQVDDDHYKRLQIRKTIQEHLQKELLLRPKGIKVLSLFFIDRVANYREYDEEGNPQPGKYARWFEEEYAAEIKKPKYDSLFAEIDRETAVDGVHDGYFASDKKKVAGRTVEMYKESRGEGKTAADEERLCAHHARQGAAAELRLQAQVHLLPLGPARGLGQSERVPDLHPERDGLGD